MKVSVPVAALAILCAIAYFEQASSSPAPELRNFWEDIDKKVKSVYQYGKRIHKNPKGEWRSFLENCISKDVLEAAAEGAKRNSEDGTMGVVTGAVRKAVAKCARKLDVYVKEKDGEKESLPNASGSDESEESVEEPVEEPVEELVDVEFDVDFNLN